MSQVASSAAVFRFTVLRNAQLFRESPCNAATVNRRERLSRKDAQIIAMTLLGLWGNSLFSPRQSPLPVYPGLAGNQCILGSAIVRV